jgi:hypothetical protein
MAFQGGIIRRRVAPVGGVCPRLLATGGPGYAAGSTAMSNGRYQHNGRPHGLTAGQCCRPFEAASSGNRHGPAGRRAR